MAIIHQASITPTKQELLDVVTGGPAQIVGSYRFDDPAGDVGVEAFVVRTDDALRHVVFTYRGAPIADPEARLVSTMEHSVLGRRWVYDGATDPVALECFRRAILGEQEQALLEIWSEGVLVDTRAPTIQLTSRAGTRPAPDAAAVKVVDHLGNDGAELPALVASWADGEAVVAELTPPAR